MKIPKRLNVIWDFEDGLSAQEIARYWHYDLDAVLEVLRTETGISGLRSGDALDNLEDEEAKKALALLSEVDAMDIPPERATWNIYDQIFGR